ncbi:DUF6965 family protein [Bacteroides ovatus]|jgi:hypothetical protein|uniref:DUF6965 family protein n=1 Tax=Bacteroides ovatus TaxID=28116 RepID=UPI00202E39AB|nr:hypothetical protein [Bacteroides ovatus]MCM1720766.1 hypothetical protein [Bacteroides ovatus]MCM1758256.1 hypothetical protein [Bacteroides ovatus]MCM1866020.1 hypothetical protein [Bacteroides ovatus]MCM1911556.1 hypothetical protein [Bacteroides ovatus]
MSNNILFIFEGKKTEGKIIEALEKHILNGHVIITCAYTSDIYQLYREIEKDDDLDTFNLMKARDKDNTNLNNYDRDSFGEIYLFFDYDAQADLASSQDKDGFRVKEGDDKIREMLDFFDNETDKGKLYISYPMVEAIRHFINGHDDFKDLKVKCKGKNCKYKETCDDKVACEKEPHYKARVSSDSPSLSDAYSKYKLERWKMLIKAHICKMNYIVNDSYILPQKLETQLQVFTKQFDKYINHKCPMVGVLSAFPMFILDYYGCEKTTYLLNTIEDYNYGSIQDLLDWAKAILERSNYPQGEFPIEEYTQGMDCGHYLESMISTISENWKNPAFYPKIDQLRKFRQILEKSYKQITE